MIAEPDRLAIALQPSLCSFGPWPRAHRWRLAVFNTVGLGLIVSGWYRGSATGHVPTQLAWLNVALAGVVIAGVGDMLWLLRGRRGVALAHMMVLRGRVGGSPSDLAAMNGHGETALVTSPKMNSYHRSSCILVQGKEAHMASRARHESAGLGRCGVCEP
jgi:hypothetical protein